MEALINIGIFASLLVVGYISGSIAEKRHYKSIKKREKAYLHVPVVTGKSFLEKDIEIQSSKLVAGSVVVSIDYFKRILAGFRNLIGGRVKSYETLLDRGRREAILRMKAQAGNADIILNLRIETSSISKSANRKKSVGSIEVYAYGTAVRYVTPDVLNEG